MTKRRAIIIGSQGGFRGLELLKGVSKDLSNYENHLLSDVGGNWDKDEIIKLLDPTANEVVYNIQNAIADYVFIVFSGHGFINTYSSSDYICLKDIDMSISKLVSNSKRQTIILDSCRQYFTEIPLEEMKESKIFSKKHVINNARKIFDDAINKTPEGIILVFSAQPGQSSGDNDLLGGIFSYSLLKASKVWSDNYTNKILTLNQAVDLSKNVMNDTFLTLQRPGMAGQIRRLTFPPFAIC